MSDRQPKLRRMLHRWRQDELLWCVVRQAGLMLGGRGGAALLSLVSMSLTLRALGADSFGRLVLIQTVILLATGLASTHSWQTLIKYGTEARTRGERRTFGQLIKTCFLLDVASCVAGFLVALAGVVGIAYWWGWPAEAMWGGVAYSFTVLVHVVGMATGLLRMEGRFRLLAVHQLIFAAIRLAAVAMAFALEAGFLAFLWIWLITEAFNHLLLLGMGLWALGRRRIAHAVRQPLSGLLARCDGLRSFVVTTNLNSITTNVILHLDVIVVAAVLGEAGAGLYAVLKKLGGVIQRLAEPLRQVIYPAIAQLVAEADERRLQAFLRRLWGMLLGAGLVVLGGFAVVGPWLVPLVTGPTEARLYVPALVYIAGALIGFCMLPVGPLFLSRGWHRTLFVVHQCAVWFYLGVLAVGAAQWGLIGAAAAYPLFYAFLATLSVAIVRRRQLRLPQEGPSARPVALPHS